MYRQTGQRIRAERHYFERKDFSYDAEQDRYQCPAGNWLTLKQRSKGERIYQAAIDDCGGCQLKARCTKARRRYVSRHAHEEAFERMAQRMQLHPEMMKRRRSIVEHPFGNLSNGYLVMHGSCCDSLRGREPKWHWR
ncbi:hypothetical protein D3C84_609650 [compost metagenome]